MSIADMREAVIYDTNERITEIAVRSSNVKPVPVGTPLMSFKLTVGRVAVAGIDLFTNEAIAAFHVDHREVSPRWLVHVLPSAAAKVVTDTAVKGVTLNKPKLREIPLDLPPLPEQRRIAEILDTLDEAIRKTEQVIAKLQQIKQGLLHDLLTRGIDEHGELRDPERHPEQFKDSPLGRIPRGWEVRPLGTVLADIRYGTSAPSNDDATGYPVLRIPNVQRGELDLADLKFQKPSPAEVARFSVQPDDLLVIRTNGNPRLLGRCAHVPHPGPNWLFASYLIRLKLHAPAVLPAFAAHYINGPMGRRFVELEAKTSAGNYNINTEQLGRLPLATPPPAEQADLVRVVAATGDRLAQENGNLAKLRTLKRGLMDDLLTGRVRVTVPTEATA